MNLEDLCFIQLGYTVRKRLDPLQQQGTYAIQLRDLPANGHVNTHQLIKIELEDLSDKYFVQTGDVLFRSRGDQNTACAITDTIVEPTVALLPLYILRPKSSFLEAEYLAWWLNQPSVQRHFDKHARGTNLRMIPRSTFNELELDLPDVKTQQTIVHIHKLAQRERNVLHRIADRRRTVVGKYLENCAKQLNN